MAKDPQIPRWEFEERMERARKETASRGLDALLVVGRFFDRPGHVLYLCNHYPPFPVVWSSERNRGRGYALLVLPVRGDATLIVDTPYYRKDLVAVDDVRVGFNLPELAVKVFKEKGLTSSKIGMVGEDVLSVTLYKDMMAKTPNIVWERADDLIEDMRLVKSPLEQEIMREAAEVADKGLTAILDNAKAGVSEQELYAIGVYTVLKEGGTYCRPRIISGPDSGSMSLRWPPATERRLEPGDVVVVDFWGYYKNYLFDINRTIGIGPLNKDKRDLLEAGLEATLDLIKHIKPGLTSADLYNISYDFVSRQEKERNPILKVGYIGQIGHGIGLESERPRITEGEQTVIKEGMILSIEPGFYIPNFGGVRIEDEVLVTKDGCENITKCRHVAW